MEVSNYIFWYNFVDNFLYLFRVFLCTQQKRGFLWLGKEGREEKEKEKKRQQLRNSSF